MVSQVIKAAKSVGGMSLAFDAINVAGGVSDYKAAREQGDSQAISVARRLEHLQCTKPWVVGVLQLPLFKLEGLYLVLQASIQRNKWGMHMQELVILALVILKCQNLDTPCVNEVLMLFVIMEQLFNQHLETKPALILEVRADIRKENDYANEITSYFKAALTTGAISGTAYGALTESENLEAQGLPVSQQLAGGLGVGVKDGLIGMGIGAGVSGTGLALAKIMRK